MGKRLSIVLLVFAAVMLSCTLPGGDTPAPAIVASETTAPLVETHTELPFEGIWTDWEGTVLILTADRFYLKFMQGTEMDVATENFAEILDYDLDSGRLHLYMYAVMLNNRSGGFDYPQRYLIYQIAGDRIRIVFTDSTYTDEYQSYELNRY